MVTRIAQSMSSSSALSTEESEKKWTATAQLYIKYFERYTVAIGCSLLASMRLEYTSGPLRVLECGCGAGGLALTIAAILKRDPASGHQFTIMDLSEGMMGIARSRLSGLQEGDFGVATMTGDATSLPLADNTIDRYICNMTVHYTPTADMLLREAARVLAPGGIAGFTVWGRKEHSNGMTMLPAIKEKMGLIPQSDNPAPNHYHMGEDDAALRARFIEAGFKTCTIWHAPAVLEAVSPEEFVHTMVDGSNSTKNEVSTWPDETQEAFRAEVLARATECLARGEPLVLDTCYIIASK